MALDDQKLLKRSSRMLVEQDHQGKQLPGCVVDMPLGECASSFTLENAVCNHGFFMMAPNNWIPSTKTLQRPLRLADSTTSLTVSISQSSRQSLSLLVHGTDCLSSCDQQAIKAQVARMLRISQKDEKDVQDFQSLHREARKRGFGRLFRSPTLFEDAVKSLLLCNCTFERTLKMAKALCALQQKLSQGLISLPTSPTPKITKRKRRSKGDKHTEKSTGAGKLEIVRDHDDQFLGNFPNSRELASLNEDILDNHCRLGYRARQILGFARHAERGKFEHIKFEGCHDLASEEKILHGELKRVKGFGPFACANMLMCLGFYGKIPVDSETVRHVKEVWLTASCFVHTAGTMVDEIYKKYAPFQCLAYWFELLDYYEKQFGKLSELPKSAYGVVTGSRIEISGRKCNEE
ncbi:hypothetical protein RJ640_027899 [Escallonia rubra]|uniref:HhH-GPD domain-containing protein n=1 Tax=Escallonia rubra TaxID=112253 RepID=A0AA88U8U2_9ASTE|nr:hypothetical protein RJ640_027899 [Escallonia rubra]